MKKQLLLTTAFVILSGATQAAESPIQVTMGGYVDFRAAMFHESVKLLGNNATNARRHGDFATEYGLNIAAVGKASGVDYGAAVVLNNRATQFEAVPTNQIKMDQAYVWVSGKYGKALLGDEHGASDLFVIAPTVGEGQIDGSYTYFTDTNTLARFQPAYIDLLENNSKATYYTPKFGNNDHTVQLGLSYTPDGSTRQTGLNSGDSRTPGIGNDVALYKGDVNAYRDVVEAVAQYAGKFNTVGVKVTPMLVLGAGEANLSNSRYRDATLWGVGVQTTYEAFTLGGSYVDAGHLGTWKNADQTKTQNVWTVGLKYEQDKVALATNFMKGKGYYGQIDVSGANANITYVDSFTAVGAGATYTWFPGLTSAADAVFFDQNREDSGRNNIGHVLMLSQKMAF